MIRLSLLLFVLIATPGCKDEIPSPCLIQATYDRCGFVFRLDSTYEWVNGSGLGVFTEEGTYRIQDSIITLDKSNVDNVVRTNRLLITTGLPWATSITDKFVLQVNAENRVIDSHFVFKVYVDSRQYLSTM
jgi:hypothetical protein